MQVTKDEFYKKIGNQDVIVRAEKYWTDFVSRYSGRIVGRVCDSIGIHEDEDYDVSTYYIL